MVQASWTRRRYWFLCNILFELKEIVCKRRLERTRRESLEQPNDEQRVDRLLALFPLSIVLVSKSPHSSLPLLWNTPACQALLYRHRRSDMILYAAAVRWSRTQQHNAQHSSTVTDSWPQQRYSTYCELRKICNILFTFKMKHQQQKLTNATLHNSRALSVMLIWTRNDWNSTR